MVKTLNPHLPVSVSEAGTLSFMTTDVSMIVTRINLKSFGSWSVSKPGHHMISDSNMMVFSLQDNRISLVDFVVSYYLHNVDEVLNTRQLTVGNVGCYSPWRWSVWIVSMSRRVWYWTSSWSKHGWPPWTETNSPTVLHHCLHLEQTCYVQYSPDCAPVRCWLYTCSCVWATTTQWCWKETMNLTVTFLCWGVFDRVPAQTRAYSHFLNLRMSSWLRKSSLMTSTETWDNLDESWPVCCVVVHKEQNWFDYQ